METFKKIFHGRKCKQRSAFFKINYRRVFVSDPYFFFLIFGFGINLSVFKHIPVLELGALIVVALIILRYVYLRIVHKYDLLPELFYFPRGLITILLFYKIPSWQRIENFDEGVLFFVILATGLILMLGATLYRDRPIEIAGHVGREDV